MQVVSTGPYVDRDQGPEVHDGQTVRVNRTASLLRHEVVHNPQEACSQEETYRIMAPPPLDHGVNSTGPDGVRFGQGYRYGQVVTHVQDRNHDHEGCEEPVGNIDVAFFTDSQRAEEVHNIRNPYQSYQNIDWPFQLSVFLGRGQTHWQSNSRCNDHGIPAPEGEACQGV